MIYSFRQTNSGGYYCQPAKHIIVKDARNEDDAVDTAMLAGMYMQGVAAGSDCSCCGNRWSGEAQQYATIEDALLDITRDDILRDSMESDNVPHYIVIDDLDVMDTVLE